MYCQIEKCDELVGIILDFHFILIDDKLPRSTLMLEMKHTLGIYIVKLENVNNRLALF